MPLSCSVRHRWASAHLTQIVNEGLLGAWVLASVSRASVLFFLCYITVDGGRANDAVRDIDGTRQ